MEQSCKMCGGQLEIHAVKKIAVCPYCETIFALSEADDLWDIYLEQTRLQWEAMVQSDRRRKTLQEAWLQKTEQYQKAKRKMDRVWNILELPIQAVCMFAIFFFAAMCSASMDLAIQTIGSALKEYVFYLVMTLPVILLLYLAVLLIPGVFLWLLWRRKDRYRQTLRKKAEAEFFQRELQLWSVVHSLENYRAGTIQEDSYIQAAQDRRTAFERGQQNKYAKRWWQRALQAGIPLLLGLLLGLGLNLTPL